MRIAVLDDATLRPWRDSQNRLATLAARLHASGHETHRIEAPLHSVPPILTGLPSETDAKALLQSARVVPLVKVIAPDLCLVPLRGGLAHGLLMARTCGEIDARCRVILVGEGSSRAAALAGEPSTSPLGWIVADALERFCLSEADGLLADPTCPLDLAATSVPLPPVVDLPPGTGLEATFLIWSSSAQTTRRLVYVGVFDRQAVAFIDAVEQLAATGAMVGREIAFVGPFAEPGAGLNKTWLGRRAARWSFEFEVRETQSWRDALAFAMAPGCCALVTAVTPSDLAAAPVGCRMTRVGARDAAGLLDALRRHLSAPGDAPPAHHVSADDALDAALRQACDLPARRPWIPSQPVALSVCILHQDRPALLAQAVESVRAQAAAAGAPEVEMVVLDNGSTTPGVRQALDVVASQTGCRVIRQAAPSPVAHAMNTLAREARHPVLVFLDDDNLIAPGGLARLAATFANPDLDIAVSNLDIFDVDASSPSVGTLAFIGPARTAGLLFNGFGDTAMGIRRSAFEAIGGFLPLPGPYTAPDWLLLARAQAAGLRIAVLQTPAFRYRRDLARAETSWQKYDQHGIRSLLLRHYGDAFDPLLLAALAQRLLVAYG